MMGESQVTSPADRQNILLEDTNVSVCSPQSFRFRTSTYPESPEIGTPRSTHEKAASMHFATGNQMLLLVQDSLKQLLNERMEMHPQVDANQQMREANFLMRTLITSVKAND